MTEDLTGKRLKDVEDSIRQDLNLLKSYEDELRYAVDPRIIAKYSKEIERQRESLARFRKELEDLTKEASPAKIQNAADLLQQKETKLDAIQNLMNMHPRIFISYSRSDGEEFARKLRRRLTEEYHLSVWQDLTSMEGGKDWWQQIEKALRNKHVEYLVLVMTHNALRSDMVKREWRLARTLGVCVEPVIATKGLDFRSMPLWMRAAHFVDPDVPEQWDRFILSLKSPCKREHVPSMEGDFPKDFVERPGEFNQLVSNLLGNKREDPVAIITALRGAGGYGKTTLARAVCHDEHIQEAFFDGILWVTLGKEPGDLIEKVNDMIEILSGERPGFRSIEFAANHLVELLANRHMLIVIDDVWKVEHLRPFLQGGPQCARLITTRNLDTLPCDARRIDVDAMQKNEAIKLLCSGLPHGNENDLGRLAARLGEWPLLLKLANGVMRDKVHNKGLTLIDALAYVHKALDNRGLTFFNIGDVAAREQAVKKTLGVSLELLDSRERARYNELAIFPEDVDIPMSTLEKLWNKTGGFSDFDTEELCDRLDRLSLLLLFDPKIRQIRLHDVVRQYLIGEQQGILPSLHNQFLDAYGFSLPQSPQSQSTDWAALPAKEQYIWKNIAYHLVEARRREELKNLLFDFGWIHAKLEADDIYSLIKDYDYISDDRTLLLVQGAIRLSAHTLAEDKTQLAGQFLGRLQSLNDSKIQSILKKACGWNGHAWLRPITASLTSPGSTLQKMLNSHRSPVRALAITSGNRAISGSNDGVIRIWDITEGIEICQRLEGHKGTVRCVAITPDGNKAVSGSEDNTIKVWNLDSFREIPPTLKGHTSPTSPVRCIAITEDGKMAPTLEGHTSPVRCIAITEDGKMAFSGSDDMTLRVWDLTKGSKICQPLKGHKSSIRCIAATPDGKKCISGSVDGTLKVWNFVDPSKPEEIVTLDHGKCMVNTVALTQDGKIALSGASDGSIKMWSLEDMEKGEKNNPIALLKGHTDAVFSIAISPENSKAVSGSYDNTLRIWNLKEICKSSGSGDCFVEIEASGTLAGHTGCIRAVGFPNEETVLSASDDETIKIWSLEKLEKLEYLFSWDEIPGNDSGRLIDFLKQHYSIDWVKTARIGKIDDGKTVRLSFENNYLSLKLNDEKTKLSLEIDDAKTDGFTVKKENGKLNIYKVRELKCHTDWINVIDVMPGNLAISASDDSLLKVWNSSNGKWIRDLKYHELPVRAISGFIDENGDAWVVSGSYDANLKLWSLKNGSRCDLDGKGEEHKGAIRATAVTKNGKFAISGSLDGTVKVWDLKSRELFKTLKGHKGPVRAVAVDEEKVLSGSYDGTIKVWDLLDPAKVKEIGTLKGHNGWVNKLAVIPDSKVVSASEDGTIRIWCLENLNSEAIHVLYGHDGPIRSMAVSSDGEIIISGSSNGTLNVWNLTEDTTDIDVYPDKQLVDGEIPIKAVAISSDGKISIAGYNDGSLRVWNLDKNNYISFTGDGPIIAVAVSQNADSIVAGETSGRIHFLSPIGINNLNFTKEYLKIKSVHKDSSPPDNHEEIQKALDKCVKETNSGLGYLASVNYVGDKIQKVQMKYWSETASEECKVAHKTSEYTLERTGLWGEPLRRKATCIVDNYLISTRREGFPKGHFPLKNFLSVPLFDKDGKIPYMIAVANKEESGYSEDDVKKVIEIMLAINKFRELSKDYRIEVL